jgi:sterol desaturase/sphingolipid hydroxylase (fatty acid hydroxylase superfamily)
MNNQPSSDRILPPWLTGSVIALTVVTLTGLELFRALRRLRENKVHHVARNLAVAGIAGAVMGASELPVIVPFSRYCARRRIGLLNLIGLPRPVRSIAAIILLDYTLYWWHVLTHRVPLLWRFHLPHHIDLDCDASTALRFHPGELLLSVPFRAAQVALFGVHVREYSIWQTLLFVSILFHHSNVDLSPEWDRRISRILITPRMHGIHHDAVESHADSNWSSGLSLWDRIHRTFQLDVPQQEVIIGVPAYQRDEDVTLAHTLLMPFTESRRDWDPARDYAGGHAALDRDRGVVSE